MDLGSSILLSFWYSLYICLFSCISTAKRREHVIYSSVDDFSLLGHILWIVRMPLFRSTWFFPCYDTDWILRTIYVLSLLALVEKLTEFLSTTAVFYIWCCGELFSYKICVFLADQGCSLTFSSWIAAARWCCCINGYIHSWDFCLLLLNSFL